MDRTRGTHAFTTRVVPEYVDHESKPMEKETKSGFTVSKSSGNFSKMDSQPQNPLDQGCPGRATEDQRTPLPPPNCKKTRKCTDHVRKETKTKGTDASGGDDGPGQEVPHFCENLQKCAELSPSVDLWMSSVSALHGVLDVFVWSHVLFTRTVLESNGFTNTLKIMVAYKRT